jgi:rhamnose utilization protein RhaD (predicted bifunctional aldolase and dehydrogenase)
MNSITMRSELHPLLNLSAHLGRDRLLTQASSGNTSMKLGRILWIKASGKWLSNALHEDILVPVDLALGKEHLRRNNDLATLPVHFFPSDLKPSIETAMHLVINHRVIAHVHSVNAIALAIRSDAQQHLRRRLHGLRWEWVPYVPSGLPLALEIERRVRNTPSTDVFVLGNHGLIVCGSDCDEVRKMLDEVERRLQFTPRHAPVFDGDFLEKMAKNSGWRLPEQTVLHALSTDEISRKILSGGVLYPCQAIFLGGRNPWQPFHSGLYCEAMQKLDRQPGAQPFVIVDGKGVLISDTITSAELETLLGLVEVVQRVDDPAHVRYLTDDESRAASSLGAYRTRSVSFERPALSA